VLTDDPAPTPPVYALDAVLARFEIGPFRVQTRMLPHSLPNAGLRLTAGDRDLLLAEATFVDEVPEGMRAHLSSARVAGEQAAAAGAGRLLLTHLPPGTDHTATLAAADAAYGGDLGVATTDLEPTP
jgi:ribonuclease BN (tRNA processing enzyme)